MKYTSDRKPPAVIDHNYPGGRRFLMWRKVAAAYLVLQSTLALLWWGLLWSVPPIRALFIPPGVPEAALLAFFVPDLLLFIGAGLWSARQLSASTGAVLPLALHTGASVYAALYCLSLLLLTRRPEAAIAAVLMAPCLVVQPYLLWRSHQP